MINWHQVYGNMVTLYYVASRRLRSFPGETTDAHWETHILDLELTYMERNQ